MAIKIDHDLHQHTFLSSCSSDPEMTADKILEHALANAYQTICLTDHLWDNKVAGASDWYKPQDLDHIRQALPLPQADGVRFLFGCETEYCGGSKLGLAPESFDLFDFIVIPPNHFHMVDFVRPAAYNTPVLVAELLQQRLEELQLLDLPWQKIGLAHLTTRLIFREGDVLEVLDLMPEERLKRIFKGFAQKGAGIELNASSFRDNWQETEELSLKIYRIAKAAGCKFYFASDAHAVASLPIKEALEPVVKALGLEQKDIYQIPQ